MRGGTVGRTSVCCQLLYKQFEPIAGIFLAGYIFFIACLFPIVGGFLMACIFLAAAAFPFVANPDYICHKPFPSCGRKNSSSFFPDQERLIVSLFFLRPAKTIPKIHRTARNTRSNQQGQDFFQCPEIFAGGISLLSLLSFSWEICLFLIRYKPKLYKYTYHCRKGRLSGAAPIDRHCSLW